MGKLEKIKSGAYKPYLVNAISGGLSIGLIFFLMSLIKNNFLTSLFLGFGYSFLMVIVIFTLGFFAEEWYKRRNKIKLLSSNIYSGLQNIGLSLNNDLDYIGYIDNYFVRFITFMNSNRNQKKAQISHSMDIYCYPTDFDELEILINNIKALFCVRNSAWGYGILSTYFYTDTQHHENNILTIVNLLKDYQVNPIDMQLWENTYGMDIRKMISEQEQLKTKKLLKIGKLDIKYKRG